MGSCLKRILALSRLTVIDGVKRYALVGLVLFALAGEAGGLLFFDFIPRDIGRAANDYLFSIIWITGFIFLLFHAVRSVAWDDEHRVIHTILARPISRTEYILGIFIGHSLVLFFLNLILGVIGWLVLNVIQNSLETTFIQQYSFIYFALTLVGIFWIELMILAIIHLLSGAIRGSFPVLLMTLSYYFICSGLPVVRESVTARGAENTSQGLSILLKWMTAFFPDFSRLDFKILVTTAKTSKPALGELFPIFGLSALYIAIVLWFASMLYQRRDLN